MNIQKSGAEEEWKRLVEASRTLIASRGLAKFSLRTLAQESGWTIGELSYRIGSKDQLIERLLAAENVYWQAQDDIWLREFAGVTALDRGELAAIVITYLDHLASERRLASIVRYELLVERAMHSRLQRLKMEWVERTRLFWLRLLDGRVNDAAPLARVIHSFVLGELIFTLALGRDPAYQVARQVCVHRLCNGIMGVEGKSDGQVLKALHERQSDADPTFVVYSDRARATAEAAGGLMLEQGMSAVTHRSVGERLGVSGSTVAHHFPTRPELVTAAIDMLNDQARKAREAETERLKGTGAIDERVADEPIYKLIFNSIVIMALATTRDAIFLPATRRLRLERGKHSYVENAQLRGKLGFDRWVAQLSSMIMSGASVQAAARGDPLTSISAGLRDDIDILTRQVS